MYFLYFQHLYQPLNVTSSVNVSYSLMESELKLYAAAKMLSTLTVMLFDESDCMKMFLFI